MSLLSNHFLCLCALVLTFIMQASADREVFAHHMVGNTYPYDVSMWQNDIATAQAAGIDGFALNMGSDSWELEQVANAYQAAENLGSHFKLFPSFDMSVIGENSDFITSYVKKYYHSSAAFTKNNKFFVSTFAGETFTFGQSDVSTGWNDAIKSSLASQGYPIFFVPSWTGLGVDGIDLSVVDGMFSWNAWPTGDSTMSDVDDLSYQGLASSLSKTYMAGVSPWFYTHLSYKNFLYKSDWLALDRWDEMLSSPPDMIELISWNDFGESHYLGPVDGAMPSDSEYYVDGFDHTPWLSMFQMYIQAYKSGSSSPTISQDQVYYWYRPHPKSVGPSSDPFGAPQGSGWPSDSVFVAAFLTSSATITVRSGTETQTFEGQAGVNRFEFHGLNAGDQVVKVTRNGQQIGWSNGTIGVTDDPQRYNFNAVVGSVEIS